MASTKKTLDIIAENDLLKDQENLMKDIGKQAQEVLKIGGKYTKTISGQINELIRERDFEEQIIKAQNLSLNIQLKQTVLQKEELKRSAQLVASIATGNTRLSTLITKDIARLQANQELLKVFDESLKRLQIQAVLLRDQSNVLEKLKRKASIADALGMSEYTSGISNLVSKIVLLTEKNVKFGTLILELFHKWYYPIIAVYSILKKVFEIFKEMDKSFFNFRKQWGLVRADSKGFEDRLFQITKNTTQLGVKFDDAVEAMTRLGREAGSLLYVSDEMVTTVAILNKQLGITVAQSGNFLKTMATVSQSSISAQTGMAGLAYSMSKAAGVPLNDVMEDIAKASASSYAFISKEPIQLIKAAVEARRFGTSLTSLANTSKSLLNFTDSIASEMEASVLLGRGVNLQFARQLAYNKDFVGLNKELVRLAKEFSYNQMDPFQQQAFAKALGKSEEELGKILQSSAEEDALLARANKLAQEGNTSLLKQLNSRNAMLRASAAELKDLGKVAEKNFQNIRNQERLNALTDQWKRLFMDISESLIPLINGMLKIGVPLLKIVGAMTKITLLLGGWYGVFRTIELVSFTIGKSFEFMAKWAAIIAKSTRSVSANLVGLQKVFQAITTLTGFEWVTTLGVKIGEVFKFMSKLGPVSKSIISGAGKVFELIAKPFAFIAKLAAPVAKVFAVLSRVASVIGIFAKWVPIVGWVITGLQFIGNIFKQFSSIEFVKGDWIGNIWKGIKAVGVALYDTLIQPFVDVYHWIMKHLGGQSPSLIGLAIVDGIKAVGSMVLNNLLSPFSLAYEVVKSLFKTDLGKMMLNAVSSIGGQMYDYIISPFKKAWEWISSLFGKTTIQPSIQQPAITARAAEIGVPVDKVIQSNEIKSYRELEKVPLTETEKRTGGQESVVSNSEVLNNILVAINKLNDNLIAGNVMTGPINLDGQLISTNMNRGNKFRGNFGAMQG